MRYICRDCGSHDIVECQDCEPVECEMQEVKVPDDYVEEDDSWGGRNLLTDEQRKVLDNEFKTTDTKAVRGRY